MTAHRRVIWSQGMFLQPHHFQQQQRYVDHFVDARVRAFAPYGWGFGNLVLDEAQLATGRVALARASGVLPDGAVFSMPDADALPPPLEIGPDVRDELVCLAAPRERSGSTEVDFGDGVADPLARFAVVEHDLRDQSHAADDPEPVQLGALKLRLLRQRDATDAFASLGVVRVVERRADGQVVLERAYIAPQTRIDASGQLATVAALLQGLVQQRAKALAAGMGQLGHGVSEVADFMMLQLLNRCAPLLRQCAGAPSVHPWSFHRLCVQLAGELATFARADRVAAEYPIYRHDELQDSFAPVIQDLRDALSAVIQRHAVQIELVDRGHAVRTAVVGDAELLRSAGFVLAVRAQLPVEHVRQRFPSQSKLGPVERIKDLVNLQLPGVALRSLPVAPRQLPYHAGSHYFEIERQGDLWKQIERTGSLALHVAGDFPGLELELWAVRQP
ncbi:MAG: type VI secretion system baseplate subunit TssK [Proteobacteria bacterium]|jgi:type VI secretion system protein ImpJ|nr:type VI secretion system baseplate subunit TssK [Pseudomonadota bacterium]